MVRDKIKNTKLKAVTLIEVLIYLALFAIIFTVVLGFAFNVDDINQFTKSNYNFDKQIIFLDQHMRDSFNKSVSIDSANSIFNVDGGKVVINTSNGAVSYRLDNSRLIYTKDSVDHIVSQVDVNVDSFYIEPVMMASSGGVNGIKLTVELSKDNAQRSISTSYIVQND